MNVCGIVSSTIKSAYCGLTFKLKNGRLYFFNCLFILRLSFVEINKINLFIILTCCKIFTRIFFIQSSIYVNLCYIIKFLDNLVYLMLNSSPESCKEYELLPSCKELGLITHTTNLKSLRLKY